MTGDRPAEMTAEEKRRLDEMAEACPRCDAWLGRLLQLGVLRKPREVRHG